MNKTPSLVITLARDAHCWNAVVKHPITGAVVHGAGHTTEEAIGALVRVYLREYLGVDLRLSKDVITECYVSSIGMSREI